MFSTKRAPLVSSIVVASGLGTGIYEAVYRAQGSPVAGLGLAAIRDFASYLKYGDDGSLTLRCR